MYTYIQGSAGNITEIPRNSNHLNFSMFRKLQTPLVFRGFSVKYVLQGTEKYTVNGKKYDVNAGQYLLANGCCEGSVEICSPFPVQGMCIDIAPSLLTEVWASYRETAVPGSHIQENHSFHAAEFPEQRYDSWKTHLGSTLQQLAAQISRAPHAPHHSTPELYYVLAEKIVLDHIPVFADLSSIQATRPGTRKELYRKISRGKEYIDQHFSSSLTTEDIAREAALSEFHFFRLFRMMYGLTPHQYLLQKRLETAHTILEKKQMNVSETAMATGFPDIHSFSKAFKKYWGFPPSALLCYREIGRI